MGLLSFFSRRTSPEAVHRYDAAGGGRRWESAPSFGRYPTETLAASGPIRSRARHCVANNPWALNGINALTAGLVGTGITPASAHPDPGTRDLIARERLPRPEAEHEQSQGAQRREIAESRP